MKTNRIHRSPAARAAVGVAAAVAALASPAVAADRNWVVANGVWGTATNWSPLGAPNAADNAFIGNSVAAQNATVSLGANATALNLVISDGMTLRTQLWGMTVGGHTAITGFNDPAGPDLFLSSLEVDDGNNVIDFQTNSLTVADGARLRLNNGGRMRVNGLLELDSGTTLVGSGTIDLHSNAVGPAMVVNGQITPSSGGVLTLRQNGTARIDLDGNLEGDQTINVTGTTGFTHSAFRIEGTGLNDAFGDRLLIGRGNVVNMLLSEGWTLSQFGEVEFRHDAGRTEHAQLTGGTVTVNGQITVDPDGSGLINSDAIVQPSAVITVGVGGRLQFNQPTTINGGAFNVADGANLGFNSPININGGTFNAPGTGSVTLTGATTYGGNVHFNGLARQINSATVSSATTINGTTFDMDGVGFANWTVNAPLTINANQVETGGGAVTATINVNSPNAFSPNYLDVNVQSPGGWTMDGTMNLVGPGGGVVHANTIRGSDFTIAGEVNVTGGHGPGARLNVASGGTVNINAGGGLRLDGGTIADPNTIAGGRILGDGTLRALANHALVGSGTIGATIDFDGNAELRADGGILRVTGPIADVGVIGTASPTGQLNVSNPWNTGVAERVELLGGGVNGAQVTNDGHITGFGLVAAQGIINNGSISAAGGELTINATGGGAIDLDGTSGLAQLHAVQGNLTIVDSPSDNFDGDAFVGPGRTMTFQNGWHTAAAANVSLTGTPGSPAVIAGEGQSFFGSNLTVSGPARFDIMTLISTGTDVQTSSAGDSLTLTQDTFVASGASFTGPGELRNVGTGSLQLGEGANVGIRLVNGGPMGIDFSNQTGIASVQRFEQTSFGSLQVDLAGTVPGNDFDRLNVAEDAHLAGRVELGTLGLYVPAYLQPHEILRADAVSGHFDLVPNNKIAADRYWAVTYDADSVFATAALPGDANLDGTVNIADFAILASNFNTPGTWVNGNFNGDLRADIGDFSLLGANFNTSIPGGALARGAGAEAFLSSPRAAAVPEPTAAAGVVLGLLGLGMRRTRRGRGNLEEK